MLANLSDELNQPVVADLNGEVWRWIGASVESLDDVYSDQ